MVAPGYPIKRTRKFDGSWRRSRNLHRERPFAAAETTKSWELLRKWRTADFEPNFISKLYLVDGTPNVLI